jgi:LPS-assembly lipoprotein
MHVAYGNSTTYFGTRWITIRPRTMVGVAGNGVVHGARIRAWARVCTILSTAGLLGCGFEPLYGRHPSSGEESIHDKLGEVLIAPIPERQGTPQARIAVALRNALQFDLNGADVTVSIDPVTGRPTEEIGGLQATYQLVEIATGKIVLKDSTFARAGYDIPGSGEQRFARQRSGLKAQERAVNVAAEAIRNRLASYFVAGT